MNIREEQCFILIENEIKELERQRVKMRLKKVDYIQKYTELGYLNKMNVNSQQQRILRKMLRKLLKM